MAMPESIAPTILPLDMLGRAETLAELAMNDFEASVFERHPELGKIRHALHEAGALTARLSGSGAALFALFDDREAADRASASLTVSWADVRFVVTATMTTQPEPIPSGPRG